VVKVIWHQAHRCRRSMVHCYSTGDSNVSFHEGTLAPPALPFRYATGSMVGILSLLYPCLYGYEFLSGGKKIATWNFACLFDYYPGWPSPILANFGQCN